jgi:hypothetical protein
MLPRSSCMLNRTPVVLEVFLAVSPVAINKGRMRTNTTAALPLLRVPNQRNANCACSLLFFLSTLKTSLRDAKRRPVLPESVRSQDGDVGVKTHVVTMAARRKEHGPKTVTQYLVPQATVQSNGLSSGWPQTSHWRRAGPVGDQGANCSSLGGHQSLRTWSSRSVKCVMA